MKRVFSSVVFFSFVASTALAGVGTHAKANPLVEQNRLAEYIRAHGLANYSVSDPHVTRLALAPVAGSRAEIAADIAADEAAERRRESRRSTTATAFRKN